MRTNSSFHLLVFFFVLLSTGAMAQSIPNSLGSPAHSPQPQSSDTLITVTKLPYSKARTFSPTPSPGGAPTIARGRATAQSAMRNPSFSFPSPPQDHETCIHHRHTRLRQAELAALQESQKGRWLKYLPTISAGLAPAFRQSQNGTFNSRLAPTLSVGLNSSLIYQAHRDKQQRLATREAIIQRSQLQQDLEVAKLHRLQRQLQIATNKLDLQAGVADIDRQLFNLYQQQYDNHDITPEEYLLKRKAFLQQELRNQDQITRIEAIQFEIEELAGCLNDLPLPEETPSRK